MLEQILRIDHSLFNLINKTWVNSVFDSFFPIYTDLHKKGPAFTVPLLCLLLFWIYKQRKKAVISILTCIVAFSLADLIAYRVFKKNIQRDRPEYILETVNIRTYSHSSFSFPSNHATNTMAVATVLGFALPGARLLFFILAALVAYSRVYVGAHFPADVLAGMVLGFFIGLSTVNLETWIQNKLSRFFGTRKIPQKPV